MYYKSVVKTKIIRQKVSEEYTDEQGNVTPASYINIIDIPCQYNSLTLVSNNVNFYCNIPQGEEYTNRDYIAYVITKQDLSGWEGYIGNPVTDWPAIQNDYRYLAHWTERDENGQITPIYFGMTWDEEKEHPQE